QSRCLAPRALIPALCRIIRTSKDHTIPKNPTPPSNSGSVPRFHGRQNPTLPQTKNKRHQQPSRTDRHSRCLAPRTQPLQPTNSSKQFKLMQSTPSSSTTRGLSPDAAGCHELKRPPHRQVATRTPGCSAQSRSVPPNPDGPFTSSNRQSRPSKPGLLPTQCHAGGRSVVAWSEVVRSAICRGDFLSVVRESFKSVVREVSSTATCLSPVRG
ncbi:MAG: hypothetical protein RL215_2322, partial [Planctomycetota bacterium]